MGLHLGGHPRLKHPLGARGEEGAGHLLGALQLGPHPEQLRVLEELRRDQQADEVPPHRHAVLEVLLEDLGAEGGGVLLEGPHRGEAPALVDAVEVDQDPKEREEGGVQEGQVLRHRGEVALDDVHHRGGQPHVLRRRRPALDEPEQHVAQRVPPLGPLLHEALGQVQHGPLGRRLHVVVAVLHEDLQLAHRVRAVVPRDGLEQVEDQLLGPRLGQGVVEQRRDDLPVAAAGPRLLPQRLPRRLALVRRLRAEGLSDLRQVPPVAGRPVRRQLVRGPPPRRQRRAPHLGGRRHRHRRPPAPAGGPALGQPGVGRRSGAVL